MRNLNQISEKTFVATVEHHATIGSTNDRAAECAADPRVKLPLLVVADEQTAGRGRGSNRWWTGPGSLAFSLLVGPEQIGAASMRHMGLIALAAGVAVVDAIRPLVSDHTVGIHWPNDVMADGRKLAGILIESMPARRHSSPLPYTGERPGVREVSNIGRSRTFPDIQYILGVGINTNNTASDAPEELRSRVATLRELTGRTHDATELLVSLLDHIERQLAQLAIAPERIAARTHELCVQRGKFVQIRQGEQVIEGTCQGIASDGALLLECDGQGRAIHSGVVLPGEWH